MKKELKRENVENLSYKDIAFLMLEQEKSGMNTLDLFTKIVNLLELSVSIIENKIGDFYTSLTTDKRFILIDGLWDLRSRHTSDKVIIDSMEEDDTELEEAHEDMDSLEDEYSDDYTSDSVVNDNYDDTTDDDLSDLVVIDEEDLSE